MMMSDCYSNSTNGDFGGEEVLRRERQYQSTSNLDKYHVTPVVVNKSNKSTVLINASSTHNLMSVAQSSSYSYMPKTTLSTFSNNKNKPPPTSGGILYRDDPNPYKVSDIGGCMIQVQDPFVPKSHSLRRSQVLCYEEEEEEEGEEEDDLHLIYTSGSEIRRSGTIKSSSGSGSHKSGSGGSGSACFSTIHHNHHNNRNPRISTSISSRISCSDVEGECEIPEPDYASSSDDIPIPLPDSSCSEEYSSVSGSGSGSGGDHHRRNDSPSGNAFDTSTDSGVPTPIKLTAEDRSRIESCLKGRKTSVHVSDSLANLYVKKNSFSTKPSTSSPNSSPFDDWILLYPGVPVLLLDLGETRSRDKRRIQFVLADPTSGLALWRDVIDHLSAYKVIPGSNTFHTFCFSQDHTNLIGLSFDDEEGALKFSDEVTRLTSDFKNIGITGKKDKKKKNKEKGKKVKFVKPKKSEISQPCCFQHVASLANLDKGEGEESSSGGSSGRLSSLKSFFFKHKDPHGDHNKEPDIPPDLQSIITGIGGL